MLYILIIADVAVGYSKKTSQAVFLGAKSDKMVVLDINSQYFSKKKESIVDAIQKRLVLNARTVSVKEQIKRRYTRGNVYNDCKYCNNLMSVEIPNDGGIMIYQFGTCDTVWYIDSKFENIITVGHISLNQVIIMPTIKKPFMTQFDEKSYMTPNCLFEFGKSAENGQVKLGEMYYVDVARYMKTISSYGYKMNQIEAITFYQQMQDKESHLWSLFVVDDEKLGKQIAAAVFDQN